MWPVGPIFPAVPIDKDQVHRELVREKDVHKKERREVKNDTETEDPPAPSSPKNRERKQQFPEQHKSHCKRQERFHLWQPERQLEVGVVEVVQ